ncbi:uncharacterized protein LOC121374454 [Gigantopelta aegis]|uniref:uncharacterized protein LOC121374454 n=1 Tax=Gigantopelta aegis TaxID=1735272 RepID=UPI001B889653|nr:uncharacterized protein LOC121374454 [Gigantopelta aegis]
MEGKMMLAIFLASVELYAVVRSSCPACTNIDNFSDLVIHNTAMDSTFKILKDFGLLRCVQQCLFRTRCNSINFDISRSICELNQATNNSPSFRNGSLFSEMTNWPKRLAGICENRSCPTNKTCVIEKQGSQKFTDCITDDRSPLDKGYTKAPAFPFFYKTYTVNKNYADASQTCHDEGARLMEPDTEEKNTFIRGIIDEQNTNHVFFGLTDFQDIGDYRWVSNNATLTFNDWQRKEPQLGRGEFCAAFYKGLAWQWVNIYCYRELQFMCEITVA